jgi:hypothetical protein
MMKEYDEVFNQIVASVKKSPEHIELLKREHKLHMKSRKFISDHKEFFMQRRRSFWRMLEESADPEHKLPESSKKDSRSNLVTIHIKEAV